MFASEVITRLQELIARHGDFPVCVSVIDLENISEQIEIAFGDAYDVLQDDGKFVIESWEY